MPKIFKSSLPSIISQGIFQILFMVKSNRLWFKIYVAFFGIKTAASKLIEYNGAAPLFAYEYIR